MKKIFGVLLLGLFAVLAFSMRALADNEACCEGKSMGMHEKMMGAMREGMDKGMDLEEMFSRKAHLIMENATELGLSDEQVQKIKTLKMDLKKSKIKSDADLELLVIDIEEALGKEAIDVNNTNTLIDKKYTIKSQETKTLVGAYADLKNVLSKEQMKKLHDILSKEKDEECKGMKMGGKEEREHKTSMRQKM